MSRRALVASIYAAAAVLAWVGWREMWFLTDDAFISFRYLSNAFDGRGLVWNPPPFLPVEGYTNFGWIALLGAVWATTGIAPPRAANALSFALGLGTLAFALRIAWRARLPARFEPWRPALAALALLGIATNRTFVTWLSSGLETSLFTLCVVGFACLALERDVATRPGRALALGALAAAGALTRPDGWLLVLGTAVLAARAARPAALALLAPLALPVAHLLWRRAFYGEWLPNTYYAKQLGAWPESGLRYAASFAVEYALWVWLAAAGAWAVARVRRGGGPPALAPVVVAAVVAAHFAYYTLRVGGDHFEYRVYAHLVPLAFASFAWLLADAGASPRATAALLAAFVALSWPIPWMHHALTRDLATREETHVLVAPVAPHLPPPLRWLAAPFDRWQAWLIPRHVCMRHREHAVYLRSLEALLPSRDEGATLSWGDRDVLLAGNVGLLGWVLPNVAILDMVGLNDWVVARTPPPPAALRKMAHERVAPPDYLACYAPNTVVAPNGDVLVQRRAEPLDDARIAACERAWRARAGEPIRPPPGLPPREAHP
ncbi:MAG: hypothetical protein R3E88_18385 [Myxococcota bacterium]